MKKILYLDMDNVLVDFPSAFARVPEETLREYEDNEDENEQRVYQTSKATNLILSEFVRWVEECSGSDYASMFRHARLT